MRIRSVARRRAAAALAALACLTFAAAALAQSAPDTPIVKSAAELAAEAGQPQTMQGTGSFVAAPARAAASAAATSDGGITLNFVNADVRDVAKAVLGDFLGLNYAVGANVQGTVTMQTSRPLGKTEVLPMLEQALQLNGLALVRNGNVYNVVPIADAQRGSGPPRIGRASAEPGFGIEIVPLKFVGAVEMQHLLEPLVPSQAIVHADASRNFLIIEGSEQERAAMVDEVALFDVDWLAGMSFALLQPKYTDAINLTKELNEILGGEHSPLEGVVRLVPIQRLNAVLAISPQPRYLDQLRHWVDRLDRPGEGSDRRIYVYAVQNGNATDLADVVKRTFYGGNAPDSKDQSQQDDSDFSNEMQSGAPQPQPAQTAKTDEESAPDNSKQGGPTITVDKTNNALVIYATPQQYGVIESALHELDTVPVQIQLEAAIAEVTLNDGLQYGVQYFYQPSDKHQFVLSNSDSGNIASAFPGFSYIFSQGTNIRVILNALSTVTHVEVISSPSVMVLNNRTAKLIVGAQVPIATAQAVSVASEGAPFVNNIEYHATGVILKVTPAVNKGGTVTMDVSQEVSNVADDTGATSALSSPTFDERKIESTIAIHDNETVALGGLISDSRTKDSSGLPFLSEIPVLGGLFGTKNDTHVRTELMVLITPHVVANLEAARAVTDELRRKFPAVQPLFAKRK